MSAGMPYGLQAMLKVLSFVLFFERFVSFLLLLLLSLLGFVVVFPRRRRRR
jgi:hypothetical protein